MAYLDENGLEHFWGKIKDHVSSAVAPKANDADVLHKMGDEVITGEKVFADSRTSASGNKNNIITLKDEELTRGTVPLDEHFSGIGIIDSQGSSYPADVENRLAALAYKAPSSGNLSSRTYLQTYKFDGSGSISLEVGYDADGRAYAKAPAISDDRTASTDIVTRGFMEASEWNWQKTKKNAVVQFKPAPESDLEPVVDFMFTETPPAEGEKGPDNPSTITGVSSAKVTRCGKNLLLAVNDNTSFYGISITRQNDGSYLLNGTSSSSQERYFPLTDCGDLYAGPYATLKLDTAKTYTLSATVVSGSITGGASVAAGSTVGSGWIPGRDMSIAGGGSVAATRSAASLVTGEFVCRLNIGSGTSFNNVVLQVQLEEGNTATAFEAPMLPVDANYTIQLGDTYYGGSLDVATGVMTVTWAGKVLTDVDADQIALAGTAGVDSRMVYNITQHGLPIPKNGSSYSICSHSNHYLNSNTGVWGDYYVNYTNNNIGYFVMQDKNNVIGTTAQAYSNWVASQYSNGTPVTFAYAVATPFTVQLTPTQTRSLPAPDKYEPRINTVYTDQEAVQVGYQRFANYVDLTTDQTIDGDKNFIKGVRIDALTVQRLYSNNPAITIYPPATINDGNHRSSSLDAVSVRVADGTSDKRLGCIRCFDINSNGNRSIGLYPFNTNNSINTGLWVGLLSVEGNNPVPYACAPSTPQYEPDGTTERTEGRDIVTRDWIPKDTRIVHTTGTETIDGTKTFTSDIRISKSYPAFALVSTSGNYSDLYFRVPDATNQSGFKTLTVLRSQTSETGTFQISRRFNGGSDAWSGPSVNLEGNSGDFYFEAQNATQSIVLRGKPDGTLTWGGQPIQTTSDERLKTTLSTVPDAVLDAWEEVNWGQFQYLDAIASKGESARLHLGLIAQHVMSVFGKHGLDACAYGILCHEERPAVDEEETVVDADAYVDEEGVEHPAVTHVETRHEDAVDLWMVRYAEAQAMEACCARRENARLKKRIADLEERLAALELKIS